MTPPGHARGAHRMVQPEGVSQSAGPPPRTGRPLAGYVAWVLVMAVFFAQVEIQIEGPAGWATSLPTWRFSGHWALEVFWGGRPMTGYHAWVFPFMALAFFSPLAFSGQWTRRAAAQALAGLMLFWVVEDFTWFLLNPAFGWERFSPAHIPWHTRWWWGAPVDYWVGLGGAAALFGWLARAAPRAPPSRHG